MDAIDDAEVLLLLSALFVILLTAKYKKKGVCRRFRVHPYLVERNEKGRYKTAVSE